MDKSQHDRRISREALREKQTEQLDNLDMDNLSAEEFSRLLFNMRLLDLAGGQDETEDTQGRE